jgi:hypothetical protein
MEWRVHEVLPRSYPQSLTRIDEPVGAIGFLVNERPVPADASHSPEDVRVYHAVWIERHLNRHSV